MYYIEVDRDLAYKLEWIYPAVMFAVFFNTINIFLYDYKNKNHYYFTY